MATKYRIKCVNSTNKCYHFGVYQTFPESPGLKSVAWQVRGVPPAGQVPSTADVDWTLAYGVAIANWDKNENTYTGQQNVAAQLGKVYVAAVCDSSIPAIDPNPIGNTSSGHIKLRNDTGRSLDMGFTIDGNLVAVQNVSWGESITFNVHPSYYVACYRGIKLGQVVDSGIQIVEPAMVKFERGYTKSTVEATVKDDKYVLERPVYVQN